MSWLVLHVFLRGYVLMFGSAAGEDKSAKDKSASDDKAAGKIQILE